MASFLLKAIHLVLQAWFAACLVNCLIITWSLCLIGQLWGTEDEKRRRAAAVCHYCFLGLIRACPWIRVSGPTSEEWRLLDRPDVLLVMTHASYFDSFLFVATCPADIIWRYRTLMKAQLFDVPCLGTISRLVGHFPVHFVTERDEEFSVDKQAQAQVTSAVRAYLAKGGCLSLYPEGRVNPTPAVLLPLRRGVFATAVEREMHVIALTAWGNHVTWPRGGMGGLPVRIRCSLTPVASKEERLSAEALLERTAMVMQREVNILRQPQAHGGIGISAVPNGTGLGATAAGNGAHNNGDGTHGNGSGSGGTRRRSSVGIAREEGGAANGRSSVCTRKMD